MNELVLPFAIMVLSAVVAVVVLGCVRTWLRQRDDWLKAEEDRRKPGGASGHHYAAAE